MIPESSKYNDVIGVYDVSVKDLKIMSDVVSQKVVSFFGLGDKDCKGGR